MSNLQSTRTDDVISLDQFSPETRMAGQIFARLSDEEQEEILKIMRILVASESNTLADYARTD